MSGKEAHNVVIYTDGGCAPTNPGPGGWAAILIKSEHQKELKGAEPYTTNNRMELMAAISGLEALTKACVVDIHTDSQYVRDGITKYINNWKRNGWRTAAKEPVKNQDLWQRLEAARDRHTVRWHWIKGHSGDQFYVRADELVREARDALKDAK
ncbi:MAG: ribonuclease [Hyphomicrobiales bacterium]|nr:ribonuclease [Hyphomicrobiales bacterium]